MFTRRERTRAGHSSEVRGRPVADAMTQLAFQLFLPVEQPSGWPKHSLAKQNARQKAFCICSGESISQLVTLKKRDATFATSYITKMQRQSRHETLSSPTWTLSSPGGLRSQSKIARLQAQVDELTGGLGFEVHLKVKRERAREHHMNKVLEHECKVCCELDGHHAPWCPDCFPHQPSLDARRLGSPKNTAAESQRMASPTTPSSTLGEELGAIAILTVLGAVVIGVALKQCK